MNKNFIEDFDWSKYDDEYRGGNRLIPNKKIKGLTNKDVVYSREPYAQEMFDTLKGSKVISKDLVRGDCITITSIYNVRDESMVIELIGGLTVEIDLTREKRFIQLFGYETVEEFVNVLQKEKVAAEFVSQGLIAYVIESTPLKISLWQGYLKKIREEFMKEIESPSKAYVCKIFEANKGGFFVEVQGIEAFMPGSLAAPNKILDFQSYVGKEVIVMIEDYLADMNSFIVSHKKYIEHVLPSRIKELDLSVQYSGTITGTSKYGIFVEFDDIFTGLLHVSKMKDDTLEKFKSRIYKAGDVVEFYINEITKDNRIILTEENPEDKKKKFDIFVEENKDKALEGEIAAIMNFGVIINVGEMSGLVPNKEFRKRKISVKNFIIGDKLKIILSDFKDEKLVFNLYVEEKEEGA
jgi:ribosomal protein S1